VTSARSGQYRSGDLTIGTTQIPAQTKVTIFVSGDVNITGDITFSNSSASSFDRLQSFIIVATGDINIAGNVTELNGWFVAGGDIDTCSDGPARLSSTVCDQQLIVRGAVAANDIQFRRTWGTVNPIDPVRPKEPAELFIFDPRIYLADHQLIPKNSANLNIERTIDLPPVIN
jgi:hypothetical protein